MSPFLKLISTDCKEYAIKNGGVLSKDILEEICLNPSYQPIFDLFYKNKPFSLAFILPRCDFLEELTAKSIKEYGVKAKAKQYICLPAYKALEKEKLLEPFYLYGLEPHLFLKTLYKNLNKRALGDNAKRSYIYNLEHLFDESPLANIDNDFLNEQDGVPEPAIKPTAKVKHKVQKMQKDKGGKLEQEELLASPDALWIEGNTEKLFLKGVLKNALQIIDKKVQNECFDYFRNRSLAEQNLTEVDIYNEGQIALKNKAIKEHNNFAHRLIKDYGILNVINVLEEIKRRKVQPSNIRSAVIFKLTDMKNEEVQKNNQYDYQ